MNTASADTYMPRPQALENDIHFWVRVYTEVDTNSGFLHDQYHLGVVYDTLHFPPNATPHERQAVVESARNRITAALRRIAATPRDADLTSEDRQVKARWGDAPASTFRDAVDNVRFQLGQSDRFEAGLRRSGAWENYIAQTFSKAGLPPELAVLPHVESSFNGAAYSKVGAAGLWQFMRSTGRRYLRIDSSVDDRMDPARATQAAAQLLDYNYRLLGTWPLALTAYNHGAGGMLRAKEAVGTDDIVQIVHNYHSPTFGFASRNYYVSFLAALEVDRNPEKYFHHVEKMPEIRFQEVGLPAYVSVGALAHALKVDIEKLRDLNPALLRSVWDGKRRIPRNYQLRLPASGQTWTTELLAQHLKPSELYAGQAEARRHKVLKGETLASLADQFGISAEKLARANRLRTSVRLTPGRVLTIPAAPELLSVADAGRTSGPPGALSDSAPAARGEPAGAAPARLAQVDPTHLHQVAANESFSEIADKHGISESELLRLNPWLPNEDYISEGQQLVVKAPAAASAPVAAASVPVPPAVVTPAPQAPQPSQPAQPQAPATPLVVASAAGPVTDSVGTGVATDLPSGAVPPEEAVREVAEDAAAAAAASAVENSEPVSTAQVDTPSLGSALDNQQDADPTDYTIARDDTIRVAPTESIGQYAEWLEVSPGRLGSLNHMKKGRPLQIGRKFKLDFHTVSKQKFEEKRRSFHQTLQAAYFASHRILGTEPYVAKKGDTYWHIAQRFRQVPIWLVQQYNPDVDFTDVHAGVKLVVPRVQAVASSED
jgi:membrane-bound lytic murein transglycosylase D